MSIIAYGVTEDQVRKQLDCDHDWHGPCMDELSRYNKCLKCLCLERDFPNKEALFKAMAESEKRSWSSDEEPTPAKEKDNVLDAKELGETSSKKAMEFIERFIKENGSAMSPSEALSFDGLRPKLEATYSCAYQVGYADAIEHALKDEMGRR